MSLGTEIFICIFIFTTKGMIKVTYDTWWENTPSPQKKDKHQAEVKKYIKAHKNKNCDSAFFNLFCNLEK